MNQSTLLGTVAVIILIAVVIGLSMSGSHEGYRKCICTQEEGGRQSACQDTDTVQDLYQQNLLTEYTNLPSKGWTTDSPGDITFPESQGCVLDNSSTAKPQWLSWDFTDF